MNEIQAEKEDVFDITNIVISGSSCSLVRPWGPVVPI